MGRIFPISLEKQWKDPKGLLQVFTGPRQVGKTTAALALADSAYTIYASADLPTPPDVEFITAHWQHARAIDHPQRTLILDEVQKIPRWSEVVKQCWDEDCRSKHSMRVCVLGSSALLIEKGLAESLTGRFEVSYFPHWTFGECRQCFSATVEKYVTFGGYPKTYELQDDPARAQQYLQNGILEPTLGRDILALHNVDKPALLRQLFWYISRLPARIVSYEKILSHLQGRGNSATLVHYAELLRAAHLVYPLEKFSRYAHRTKRSIPKWILANPALVDPSQTEQGPREFILENLVGSHLLNVIYGDRSHALQYWREEDWKIDFIVTRRNVPECAIEVKSGRVKKLPTIERLATAGLACPLLLITPDNVTAFLETRTVEELQRLIR